ncbi:MAG: hypothetical protein QOJ54_546 [Aliidongia sp.]|jgi:hypothetical protein|nr:hypothetical protein [Aliidongia sp.]
MSISPTTAPPLQTTPPRLDTQTVVQVQARAQVAVPPTAVTSASKQDGAGGFGKSSGSTPRGAPVGGRGRLVDIKA